MTRAAPICTIDHYQQSSQHSTTYYWLAQIYLLYVQLLLTYLVESRATHQVFLFLTEHLLREI